jgi:cysteine desulfurase family protein (TIGR01976 family)
MIMRIEASAQADVRSHFPALRRRHGSGSVAYFDGPGGTQVPRMVVEAMADYLFEHNANTHWAYPSSEETDALLADARQAAADFLNGDPAEIAFGANMTTLTFHLARSLGRGWSAGDEVVVTELDHHANVAPWVETARDRGLTVRTVRMHPETGQIDVEDLERQITGRCSLLAIGAASNALGTITDVRAAVERAHAVGARVFVDAVHYAPHMLTDVRQLDCDFLACSAYKFYGPHVGILWTRGELIDQLDVPKLIPAPDHGGERLETGTLNHEGIVGAAAAIDFLASFGAGPSRRERLRNSYDVLHQRGTAQFRALWDGLRAIEGVTVYGPGPDQPRTPTVAFTVDGMPAVDVARRLAAGGVFVSHGDFYAYTVVERLGLQPDGLVRAGCACYTADQDVDRLLHGVAIVKASAAGG